MPTYLPAEMYGHKLLSLREQVKIRNDWLKTRLDSFLPALMQREGIDLWLIIAREYNEDPVMMSLFPQPAMSARRRTILMFSLQADGQVERLTLDRYGHGAFYQKAWDPDSGETQYACLARLVTERAPQKIGINISADFAFGDGLSWREHQNLAQALGPELMARTCNAERLCLGWLEHRLEAEIIAYPALVELGHAIIAQAFSNHVIHPGITTTDDVVWWMRETMQALGLNAWFQPTIEIQAPGQSFTDDQTRKLIMPGDLLHCDMGFHYLGLATDQQQHAYILKPDESDAPPGLKQSLAAANQLQDIHLAAMKVGRTGNEVLQLALAEAKAAGLNPSIYSHPLGYHGHAAGPTIGLWDQQTGVPGKGDYELFDQTCYSIELNICKAVPEWSGQEVRIALEEDAVLQANQMRWLDGRQTAFHLIG